MNEGEWRKWDRLYACRERCYRRLTRRWESMTMLDLLRPSVWRELRGMHATLRTLDAAMERTMRRAVQ